MWDILLWWSFEHEQDKLDEKNNKPNPSRLNYDEINAEVIAAIHNAIADNNN